MKETVKILLVDDHPAFLVGVTSILQSIFDSAVIHTALTGYEALEKLKKVPDIDWVFLDINLPDINGIALLDEFSKNKILADIIIITADSSPEIIAQAMKKQVSGFLTKDFNHKILTDCFTCIENDQLYLSELHTDLLRQYRESTLEEKEHLEKNINQRQVDILIMISKGYKNKEIATYLGISESAIKKQVSFLMELLDAENRIQCVSEAQRLKLF